MADKIQLEENQDSYTPDVGIVTGSVCCGVCGDEMKCIAKDSCGPRGWAQAMGMARGQTTGTPHDVFECPHIKASWHRQVKALIKEARQTASGHLSKSLIEEAREVVVTRTATKKISLHDWGI
jgi:hypothetical protein